MLTTWGRQPARDYKKQLGCLPKPLPGKKPLLDCFQKPLLSKKQLLDCFPPLVVQRGDPLDRKGGPRTGIFEQPGRQKPIVAGRLT